jgi:hypothetical protein
MMMRYIDVVDSVKGTTLDQPTSMPPHDAINKLERKIHKIKESCIRLLP